MTPSLYSPETTEFTTNGIGRLSEATYCKYTGAVNGQHKIELRYPTTGQWYQEIKLRSIIYASTGPGGQKQPFRVHKISKPDHGIVTYEAHHVLYDCLKIICAPFSAPSLATALQAMQGAATTPHPFTFSTDRSTAGDFSNGKPKSIWATMGGTTGSLLDRYGGEWEFDHFGAILRNRLGADRGVSIRYGKNLVSLEQDENIADTFTGIYPYWTGQDGTLVQLPEKILVAEGDFGHTSILDVDFSTDFQDAPTEEQLREKATAYMESRDVGKPTVSIEVEFVNLADTVEYAHLKLLEEVRIGDTVHVSFPELGVDSTARAKKVEWDSLMDRYIMVYLGSIKANLSTTIAAQEKEIAQKPSITLTQQIAEQLAKAFLGVSGGSARLLDNDGDGQPDELYIADNPDPNLAVRVWRWNYNGWAASESGYNGPWIMGATLEDGILAHSITAVNATAGFIQAKDPDKFFLDLDNGNLTIGAFSDYAKFFHFTVNGLIIGEANSPAQVIIDNDEIIIQVSGTEVIRFDALGRAIIPDLTIPRSINLLGIQSEVTETHLNFFDSIEQPAVSGSDTAQVMPLVESDSLSRSGSFSGSIRGGDYTLRVDWETAPHATQAAFVPTLKMYLVQAPYCNIKIGARDNTATINGKNYTWRSPKTYNESVNKTITTHLGTIVADPVPYSADGTGSISASVIFNIAASISGVQYSKITASGTVSGVDYTPPVVSPLTVERCNEDGATNPSGNYVAVAFSASISPVGGTNGAAYQIRYRPMGNGSYTTMALDNYSGQYAVDISAIIPATSAQSFEIVAEATDNFKTVGKSATIGSASKLISFLKETGKIVAISFGKIAEIKGAFELNFVLRPHKGIGMPRYEVASLEDANSAIVAAYAALENYSHGYACIKGTSSAVELFGGWNWEISMGRTNADYGIVEAISYCTNPPTKYSRNLYGGEWGEWVKIR